MSIRFAGSRFVHERRRRRLAQECGGVSLVPVDDDEVSSPPQPDGLAAATTTIGSSPVSSIIRPQLWVHWVVTSLCVVAWAGLLYLGDLAEQTDFGLREILGLRSGRLATFFSTIMLLWAGQLSLLIYWYRRKSRNDFSGRYRMWLWIGGILQIFLVVSATAAHVPFAEFMQRHWPLNIPLYGLLCWLVPVATLGLTMYRLLRIELKRHRSGHLLLNVAVVAGSLTVVSLLVGRFLPDRWRDLSQIGFATLSQLALATSLLMHARYVVHVSNEAPRREARERRLLMATRQVASYLPLPRVSRPKLSAWSFSGWTLPALRLPKLSLPRLPQLRAERSADEQQVKVKAKGKGDSAPTVQADSRPAATEREPSRDVKTHAVLTARKEPVRPAETDRQRVDAAEQPKGPRQMPDRVPHQSLTRGGNDADDDGADDGAHSSLSKKERRRLRKKQRELQHTER